MGPSGRATAANSGSLDVQADEVAVRLPPKLPIRHSPAQYGELVEHVCTPAVCGINLGDRTRMGPELNVVVTTMASDAHTWNLVYLELLLGELGHRVVNLGACVPDELLLERCRALRPDLVVISSVNGHGFSEGGRVIRRIRRCPELARTPVIIGGTLGTGQEHRAHETAELRKAGFDLVVHTGDGLRAFREYVDQLRLKVAC